VEGHRSAKFGAPNLIFPISRWCVCGSNFEFAVTIVNRVKRNREKIALVSATLPRSDNESCFFEFVLCKLDLALAAPASLFHNRPGGSKVSVIVASVLREKIKQQGSGAV